MKRARLRARDRRRATTLAGKLAPPPDDLVSRTGRRSPRRAGPPASLAIVPGRARRVPPIAGHARSEPARAHPPRARESRAAGDRAVRVGAARVSRCAARVSPRPRRDPRRRAAPLRLYMRAARGARHRVRRPPGHRPLLEQARSPDDAARVRLRDGPDVREREPRLRRRLRDGRARRAATTRPPRALDAGPRRRDRHVHFGWVWLKRFAGDGDRGSRISTT